MKNKYQLRRFTAAVGAGAIAVSGLLTAVATGGTAGASLRPAALSSAECAANKALGTVTFVSPFGFGAGPALEEIFVAQKLGYFTTECLTVNIVTSSYTPNELVSAGTAQFTSEGSAADTIEAIDAGSSLTGLATFANSSTYVLLTTPGIKTLKDLKGKTLAYHTAMPVVLTEMLKKAGVTGVNLVNDNSYDPTLLTSGKFDALQAYTINEPLTLRADHLKFNEFFPADYGVKGTTDVVVGNKAFVKAHPAATADFLRAEMHAINYCETHASACINIEAAASNAAGSIYEVGHSLQQWNAAIKSVKANGLKGAGIGVQTTTEWLPEAKALKAAGLVPTEPSLSAMENTTLIRSIYKGTKLIWPGP